METILLMTTRTEIILIPNQRGTVAQLIERYTGDGRVLVLPRKTRNLPNMTEKNVDLDSKLQKTKKNQPFCILFQPDQHSI